MKTLDDSVTNALNDILNGNYLPHTHDSFRQTYATPGTVDHSPYPDDTGDFSDETSPPHTQDAVDKLRAHKGSDELLDALWRVIHQPAYEVAGPFTVGGKSQTSLAQIANTTGVGSVYNLVTPFDSDCEFCVVAAQFGAAGQAILTRDPSVALGPSLSQFYDGNYYTRGIPFFASGIQTFPMGIELWYPLPASDQLYWAVNMTSANTSSALITVTFRRRINRHGKFELTVR